MKLKRVSGLLLSMALLLLPAMGALAKPVATHQLALLWGSSDSSLSVSGAIDVTVEAGVASVQLYVVESQPEVCPDGADGSRLRIIEHSGPSSLVTSIDRHLDAVEVTGQLEVDETVVSCGMTSHTVSVVSVDLTGTAIERTQRSRDSITGTRFIRRAHQFDLRIEGAAVSDVGMVTKSISSAR